MHHAFFTFLCLFLHDYDMNRFYGVSKQKKRQNFISLSELGYAPWEFNSSLVRLHLIKTERT